MKATEKHSFTHTGGKMPFKNTAVGMKEEMPACILYNYSKGIIIGGKSLDVVIKMTQSIPLIVNQSLFSFYQEIFIGYNAKGPLNSS